MIVDEDTFATMSRYAESYGEGGCQKRLRRLVDRMTVVTPGVMYEGATVSRAVHGTGHVEFWKDAFLMARVRFDAGTVKVPGRGRMDVAAGRLRRGRAG